MSDPAEKLSDKKVTDSDIESWALTVADAMQRFIAERNALRERVESQDRELKLLREHVTLIRDSYRRLAAEFVTQLEVIDNVVPGVTKLHPRQKPTTDN